MSRKVIVIGGGMSGLTAAIEAAEAGADVQLLQAGQGVHHLFSGCIDLMAYPSPDAEAVANPLAAIAELPAEHPYQKVGLPLVKEALAVFHRRTESQNLHYYGDGTEQKRVLTAMGTFRLTGLVPKTMVVDPAEIDVVCGIGQFRNFAEEMVAAELSQRIGREIKTLTYTFENIRRDAFGIANRLYEPESLIDFGNFLAAHARGLTVAIPAVLGVEGVESVKERIERQFGGRLVEVSGLPPSLTGLRLMKALRRIALDAGVRIIQSARVVGPVNGGPRLRGVLAQSGPTVREHDADVFVLASGHLVTGGLVSMRETLTEPIFNLPITGWAGGPFFRKRFLNHEGHPVLFSGLPVNENLQPLKDDKPAYENLFACGDILSGFDPYRERSGGGVALATGTKAGRLAAKEVV